VAPKITDMRPAPGGGDRLTVFVDGKEAFTVSETVARAIGLSVGAPLPSGSGEALETLAPEADRTRVKVRDAALRLLAVRARSEGELADRLERKGFEKAAVREVIDALRAVGLIDDEAFAKAWADERTRLKPAGPRRLMDELIAKRIGRDLAERVVAETFARCQELELARRAAARRTKGRGGASSAEDLAKQRRRLYSFLVRRGFSYEVASTVVKESEEETDA
jgi:regulatory protein